LTAASLSLIKLNLAANAPQDFYATRADPTPELVDQAGYE
jgi:hypothetical protein